VRLLRGARLLGFLRFTILLPVSLTALSCVPARLPEQLLVAYTKAKETYLRGDLAGAERELSSVLARRRDFHQAEFLLGKVLYFQNKLTEAERVFTALLKGNPRYNEAQLWLVRIALARGDTRRAEQKLEELLSFDPNDPRLLYLMGSIAQARDDVKKALEFYQRAAAFGEELAKAHLESARLYYQFNLPERALEELRICATLISENSLLREPVTSLMQIISKEAGTP
jgi:tetratricopeptide (TPR) repeat protein